MPGRADRDLRGKAAVNWVLRNWLILAVYLATLSALGSYLQGTGSTAVGGWVLLVAWMAALALAIVDGIRRLLGSPSLLGAERGPARLLALVQILLAVVLLLRIIGL